MRVLVACEFSGIVRDAFADAGWVAASCDLLPSEKPGWHYQQDIFRTLREHEFDLIIAHPPCTYLAVCGNRWYAGGQLRERAIKWTARLWRECKKNARHVVFENPVSVLWTRVMAASQYIQPWQFGHPESKRTGLALHNVPKLRATHERPDKIEQRIWRMPPSPDRQRERSRFYEGIARAMAEQWTPVELHREWKRNRR